MAKFSTKNTDLKEQVKRGERTPKDALRLMQKRANWSSVKDTRTGRWMIRKAGA